MPWIILLRVVLSVSANAIQKRLLLNRAGIYHTWIITYLLILGPASLVGAFYFHGANRQFWYDIAIGGGLDALGNLAMVAALRVTDVSVFGPLNALRPILALVFGWFFLREAPTALGVAGVGVTVIGGVVLFADPSSVREEKWSGILRGLAFRLSGLSLGVISSVFLKRAAVQTSPQLTVAAWIICGLLVLSIAALLHRPADLRTLGSSATEHLPWFFIHSICFYIMQLLTMEIFRTTLLAYSFVYFQLGMVLQVFVGKVWFSEGAFVRRLIASIIMAAGSALVLSKG